MKNRILKKAVMNLSKNDSKDFQAVLVKTKKNDAVCLFMSK